MRSLQVKFAAVLLAVLLVAFTTLVSLASRHEREALGVEATRSAGTLALLLGRAAAEALEAEPSRAAAQLAPHLRPARLAAVAGAEGRVVAARVLDASGRVLAAVDPADLGVERRLLDDAEVLAAGEAPIVRVFGDRLVAMATIRDSAGARLGEAQVEFDLGRLAAPVARDGAAQLGAAGVAVAALGIGAAVLFVGLLVRPLRRLQQGVEQLAAGNVNVRVPPSSRDEIGELTRAFNEMGDALLEKQRIQTAFGRYVDDYVLTQLLAGSSDDFQAGMEREVTILFADVRSFTRLSEGLEAAQVVGLLNEVFQLASERILEWGGTIDKFIGDAVMAYFGAPVPHPDHAERAVAAAIEIVHAIEERNANALARDPGAPSLVPVELGIGIHTGTVVVGNIGCDRRTDFTAIGDAVNVAHRIEKLARPNEILVSEAVQRRARAVARLRFEGERQLSGRAEPVHVYAVEMQQKPSGRS